VRYRLAPPAALSDAARGILTAGVRIRWLTLADGAVTVTNNLPQAPRAAAVRSKEVR